MFPKLFQVSDNKSLFQVLQIIVASILSPNVYFNNLGPNFIPTDIVVFLRTILWDILLYRVLKR